MRISLLLTAVAVSTHAMAQDPTPDLYFLEFLGMTTELDELGVDTDDLTYTDDDSGAADIIESQPDNENPSGLTNGQLP